jgi:hypothetical protein
LQSQVNKAGKKRLSLSGLEILHGRLATISKANHIAILNLSSGGALNEARCKVGIALSNLTHSPPTQEKIDKAKSPIQAWIQELEAAKP